MKNDREYQTPFNIETISLALAAWLAFALVVLAVLLWLTDSGVVNW